MIYGFEPAYQSSAKNYVASYAGATPELPCRAVMGCLSEIQKVLDLILSTSEAASAKISEAGGGQSDAA